MMKDAKITSEEMPVVTEDDLKHELGEWIVTSIYHNKVIKQMAAQIKELKAIIDAQNKKADKIAEVEQSNQQLEKKNTELAEALRQIRKEKTDMAAELEKAQRKLEEYKKELSLLKTKPKKSKKSSRVK